MAVEAVLLSAGALSVMVVLDSAAVDAVVVGAVVAAAGCVVVVVLQAASQSIVAIRAVAVSPCFRKEVCWFNIRSILFSTKGYGVDAVYQGGKWRKVHPCGQVSMC
jgi:hypothetical protein